MDQETFLKLIRAAADRKPKELFDLTRITFGIDVAIDVLSMFFEDNEIYALVRGALGGRFEAELELGKRWSDERILSAKPRHKEFTFSIGHSDEADDRYRIEVSVCVDEGIADVWFQHIVTGGKHIDAEKCIPWEALVSEEEAMWVYLVSKIERLDNAWFVNAAVECNGGLLTPYLTIENFQPE